MSKLEKATFAGGCFWCTEAVFKRLRGVREVVAGYAGGNTESPTSEEVHSGTTGHAETIQVNYDPNKITYEDLLYVFFRTHDPTTLNRQGADVGPEYRSVIFYHNDKQKKLAEVAQKEAQKEYKDPIVTQIKPLEIFYPAGEHHQDFYEKNPGSMYCKLVIDPKIKKLQEKLGEYTK